MSFSLNGWSLAIVAIAILVSVVAGIVTMTISATRSRLEPRRERLMTAFNLPQDAPHNEVVRHYLRLVWRARNIGFAVSAIATVAALFAFDSRVPAGARTAVDNQGPGSGGQFAMQCALWYTGWLFAGAIGAAVAMRIRGGQHARASLAARDATAYVPRACVLVTFVIGPIAAVGASVSLFVGARDWSERTSLGVALGVAVAAMAGMIPLANRLAQMRMPVDADHDPMLDEALRQVSARMVAGDAVLMVTAALAVVVALLMPTYQAALIVIIMLVAPAGFVAQALQPGEITPRPLQRWLGARRPSGAQ